MTHLIGRIIRLEEYLRRSCATCRDWMPVVIVDDAGVTSRPEVCPVCGREVPIAQLVQIVGVPLEAI